MGSVGICEVLLGNYSIIFFYCIKLLKQHNSEGKLRHSEGLEIG